MNPTNPCKDQGLSLLYLSMHLSQVSCLLELEPLDPSLQSSFTINHLISPNCLHLFPTVMTVGVGPWVCTLPCGSTQLCPSCPIWSVSPSPSPISCSLGMWSSALPLCVACVFAAWVPPVRAAWALPVHAAWALSTRSWHCAHDHQPMCAGIECPMPRISFYSLHCPQCLKALLLAIRTHIRVPHPIPQVKPAVPYFS